MGKKNGEAKEAKRWEGRLEVLPAITSSDDLTDHFTGALPSLCALLEAALRVEDLRTREAATWLAQDLESICSATAAMLDGREVMLSEYELGALDTPDRLIDLSRLLQITEEGDTDDVLEPARHLIGCRLETLAAALKRPAEARA
jgi:hypothetical protein